MGSGKDIYLVGGECYVRVCEEAGSEEVAEGVVFFVEGEDGGVWRTCDSRGC